MKRKYKLKYLGRGIRGKAGQRKKQQEERRSEEKDKVSMKIFKALNPKNMWGKFSLSLPNPPGTHLSGGVTPLLWWVMVMSIVVMEEVMMVVTVVVGRSRRLTVSVEEGNCEL